MAYTIYINGYFKDKTHGSCYAAVFYNGELIGEDGISFNQGVTQNRCNLAAVLIGLRMIPNDAKVVIISDDDYTVKSVMGINKRVHNIDILTAIDEEIKSKKSCEYRWLDLSRDVDYMATNYCKKNAKEVCNRAIYCDLLDYKPEKIKKFVISSSTEKDLLELVNNMGKELIIIQKYLKERIK